MQGTSSRGPDNGNATRGVYVRVSCCLKLASCNCTIMESKLFGAVVRLRTQTKLLDFNLTNGVNCRGDKYYLDRHHYFSSIFARIK